MTLLVQISDTHILRPGNLLYGTIDSARHLRETVRKINCMRPLPDAVIFTGDLAEHGDKPGYRHFLELIDALSMSAWVLPGNHDDPQVMSEVFAGTKHFPVTDATFQYAIEDFPFRILALNSRSDGTELPEFNARRLSWLKNQLGLSEKPVLIAIHHPPMTTGIELIDMGGSAWFQGLKAELSLHPKVKLLICGHCHTDLCGRIGPVPVYMAPANSHQLIATRGLDMAPATLNCAAAPTLHHFISGDFLSGSHPWPEDVEDRRIDRISDTSWAEMKRSMMGKRSD